MHMEMEHGGMTSMGKLIKTETADGVKATFRLIDMKEKMKGMEMPAGMTDTHHLMVMFTDAKTGKALGQFGTVIACNGDSPDGTPTTTDQGLTCKESGKQVNVNTDTSDSGFNLRAGSPHHQRIVAFKDNLRATSRPDLAVIDTRTGKYMERA